MKLTEEGSSSGLLKRARDINYIALLLAVMRGETRGTASSSQSGGRISSRLTTTKILKVPSCSGV